MPLDLFPASLIDSINVIKTYRANLPGEFSGDLVQLATTEFPTQKTLTVSVNYGFNLQTAGKHLGSFAGVSIIPSDRRLFVGSFTESQFQEFGRAFKPDYQCRPIASARPTQTYSISGGNTFGKLGVVAGVTFNSSPQSTPETRRFLVNGSGGRPQIFSDYQFDVGNESTHMGAVFNAAYRLNAADYAGF